jgi:histidyl-tRNA synthetase
MGGGNFKKQLKKANASGATWAVLLGSDEYTNNQLTLKNLTDGSQETLSEAAVFNKLLTKP